MNNSAKTFYHRARLGLAGGELLLLAQGQKTTPGRSESAAPGLLFLLVESDGEKQPILTVDELKKRHGGVDSRQGVCGGAQRRKGLVNGQKGGGKKRERVNGSAST